MSLNRSILSRKFSLMPDRQTIGYSVREVATTGWAEPVPIVDCERRWPTTKEIDVSNGRINQGDLFWHVWTARLGGIKPKEGDRITFEGELWIVSFAREELIGQRWRLSCTRGVDC